MREAVDAFVDTRFLSKLNASARQSFEGFLLQRLFVERVLRSAAAEFMAFLKSMTF